MPNRYAWRCIHWGRPLDEANLRIILSGLAARPRRQPVVLEARGDAGQVSFLLASSYQAMPGLSRIIEELTPGSVMTELDAPREAAGSAKRVRLDRDALPLAVPSLEHAVRPLLHALAAARGEDEFVAVQVMLGPGLSPSPLRAGQADPTQGTASVLIHGARRPDADTSARMATKSREHGFRSLVRIGVAAGSDTRRQALGIGVVSALRSLRAPGADISVTPERADNFDRAEAPRRYPSRLSVSDVTALSAWPIGDSSYPGLPSPHPKQMRPIPRDATEGVFAVSSAPGLAVPIGIEADARRFHTLLLGPTGVGKSNAMLHLIADDLARGRSVVVLDPQANLIRDILERIPAARHTDVVVLDPTQPKPVGLNPLVVPGVAPELVADGLLAVLRGLFGSSFGPRTTDVMHASLLTLARHGGASLTWLPRLLTDPAFRRSLTAGIDDPIGLGAFWEQYESYSAAQQATVIAPTLSRLRQLLLRPSLRSVLEQVEPRFQLGDVFAKPRILLVPLNKGLLGSDAARLLGSLLISSLWQHTLARGGVPHAQRRPVSIYLDEAQDVLNLPLDIAEALSRSRAMNVSWVLAHQYRAQFPADLLPGIDANTRNKLIFRLEPADAAAMAKFTHELEPVDFQSLDRYELYARTLHAGRISPWVSARTLPPPPTCSNELDVRALSQARYGATETAGTTEMTTNQTSPKRIYGRSKRAEP